MKKLVLLLVLAYLSFAASAQSTLVTAVGNTTFCADSTQAISVSYSDAVTTYQVPNVFTVELSDAQGSFANPVVMGSLPGTASSGIIQAYVPTYVPAGTGYRIRVVASHPIVVGNDNGTDLTIVAMPQVTVAPSYTVICDGGVAWLSAQTNTADLSWSPASSLSSATAAAVTAMPSVSTTYTATAYNSCGTASATAQVDVSAFATVFRETFGQTAFTTTIAVYETADLFDNDHLTMSAIGSADVRNTLPSSGYANASGGANISFNWVSSLNTPIFQIDGINTIGMSDLVLSFGIRKNTASSNGSELVVETSTDGGATWTSIPFTALPVGSGTNTVWHYTSTTGPVPQSQNLSLRFRQTSTNTQFRIDDVELTNGTVTIPTITSSGPISGNCLGANIYLTASGGTSYAWSTGETTQVIQVTQNGTYTVAVTNGTGCMAVSNPVIVSNTGPNMPVASNNGPVCEGQTLELSVTGDPTFTYSWTGPNNWTAGNTQTPTIPNATGAHSGLYSVWVTTPSCPPALFVTYAEVSPSTLSPIANNSGPVCAGSALQFTALSVINATYTWTGPNNFYSNLQSPQIPNVTPAHSGVYSLTINTPCATGTTSMNVSVLPTPSAPVLSSNSPVCQGSNLLLSATSVSGALYSWSGPNSFFTTIQHPIRQNALPAFSGTYTSFAIQNGCASPPSTIQVQVIPTGPALSIASNLPVCPGSMLALTAVGGIPGNYTWTGPNNFTSGSNVALVPNLQPVNYGTYSVNSGSGNCNNSATIVVGAPQGPAASSNSPVCPGATIQLFADTVWAPNTYSWVGPNGFTSTLQNPSIAGATAAHAGAYSVFTVLPTCVSSPSVVVVDVNGNLSVTATNNGPLNQGGTLILSATGSNGNYTWTGPNGYTAIGQNPYIQNATPAHSGNYTATLSSAGCTTVTAVTNVVVNPMNQISGLVYNDANNNGSQNTGEGPLAGMLITLQPGNYTTLTDSLGQYMAYVPDGTYTVSVAGLGTNQISHPGNYSVTVSGSSQVSGGHNFGVHSTQVNNLMVTITELWTASPGFVTNLRLNVHNLGSAPMSGTVRFKPDAVPVLTAGTSPGYTMAADTLVWTFSNLQPNQTLYKYVHQTVTVGTPLGTVLNSTAVVTPIAGDIAPANNVFTLMQTVAGSWDPNDKAVSPVGPISPAQVAAAQPLSYTIRFQNTGTAPAVNILIVDTLSTHLNLSSFQLVATSHPTNLTLRENGILEFHFPNIMLPDSNTNEPLSHGYIQYSIKPKTTLQLGDEIQNTAHIFFDFNEAVVTNTTNTVVADPTGFAEAEVEQLLHVYPNPNNGSATLRFTAANPAETTVTLLNLLGQEVQRIVQKTDAGEIEIPVNLQQQPAGIYLVRMQQNGKVYSAKLIRQ